MIKHDDCDDFLLETIHILDIQPNSPADYAGLIPNTDYLLGTPFIQFKNYDQLDLFLTEFDQKFSEVYVYNSQTHSVRQIKLRPDSQWKANAGALGCETAVGYLHKLPIECWKGFDPRFIECAQIYESVYQESIVEESEICEGQLVMKMTIQQQNEKGIVLSIPINLIPNEEYWRRKFDERHQFENLHQHSDYGHSHLADSHLNHSHSDHSHSHSGCSNYSHSYSQFSHSHDGHSLTNSHDHSHSHEHSHRNHSHTDHPYNTSSIQSQRHVKTSVVAP